MYPVRICCHLTVAGGATFSHPENMKMIFARGRGNADGVMEIRTSTGGEAVGSISIMVDGKGWCEFRITEK